MSRDDMKERAERLKFARETAGYKTAAAFARALNAGIDDYTYRTYESGSRGISYDLAAKFSGKLGIPVEWLLTGKTEVNGMLSAPIRGRINDGGFITATLSLTGRTDMNAGIASRADSDQALKESYTSAFFALVVATKQFEPDTNEGSVVYYSRTPQSPKDCIGTPCIVQIAGGSPVFAIIQRGSKEGLFNVQGHGQDLEIEWCARREFTKHA